MVICLTACATTRATAPIPTSSPAPVIEFVKACDKVIEKCDKALSDKNVKIEHLNKELEDRMNRVSELERREILENKTVWFALGAIFSAAIMFLVRK